MVKRCEIPERCIDLKQCAPFIRLPGRKAANRIGGAAVVLKLEPGARAKGGGT